MTLALALRHLQAGDLEQAERVCKKARKREPRDPQAMHLMGVIVHHRGRPAEALKLLEKAAQRQPDNPDCQYNLAECYRALGKANSAIAGYRRALAAAPHHAMAFVGIGETQLVQGQPSEAEGRFREALAKRLDLLPALDGLARALRAQDRLAEAVEVWRRAIAFDATKPELHNNHGLALRGLGRMDEAAAALVRSLELQPGNATIRHNFAACLKNRRIMTATPALRRQLEACFDAGDVDGQGLVAPTLSLLEADAGIAVALALAAETGDAADAALIDAGRDALWDDRLFVHLLTSTFIAKPAWERLLTRLRAIFLAAPETAPDELLFALATQCFNNQFAFAEADTEQAAAAAVRRSVEAHLASRVEPARDFERDLGRLGMYLPLHALAGAERLLEPPAERWSAPFRALLARHLAEPLEERKIRATIPSISLEPRAAQAAVREMYEANPYPSWITVAARQPQVADAVLRDILPYIEAPAAWRQPLAILVAGCGTGRQAINAATRFKDCRVLAIDLSRASLGYAVRMARKLGVENIEFRQGDLLDLTPPDGGYQLIECSGVLHHFPTMDAAREGWRVLRGLLAPEGLMKIGLYSETARAHVVAGRAFVAEHGYSATPDGIRRCRQDIFALPDDRIERKLLENRDFYSTNSCRDLIFHVHELRYTLPLIADTLDALGLCFVGFELDKPEALNAYRAAYPKDAEMSDLGNWHAFEQANRDTFLGMYQFWCQAI